MIGTRLANRYEVVRELGRGGMGVVYLARDPLLERDVAVKLIPPGVLDADSNERFRREARVLARLDHPGIVGIYDFGAHDDALFYVMPLVRGQNLREMMAGAPLTLGEILEIGRQIALALHYSHAAGIIHRDIKPENVMVSRDSDGPPSVRVADFGLAVVQRQHRLTGSGLVVGTLSYLAPEQLLRHEIDFSTDLYALGVVLYELLTGGTPFSGSIASLMYSVVNVTPARPAELGVSLPAEIESLVMQCLERDRRRRPPSAAVLAETLKSCMSQVRDRDALSQPHRASSSRTIAHPGPPLIGRQKELSLLHDHLTASATEASFMLIGGPAGIGKSRLIDEVERLASMRGVLILRSAIAGMEHSLPYAGLCRLIEEHLRLRGAADLSDLAPELVQRFPLLMEVPELRAHARAAPPLPITDRLSVFDALARAFIRIATAQPVMIVIEDLHAGDISVEALGHIGARLTAVPVFLVGTYRSDEIDRAHPMTSLIEACRKSRHGALLELGPLTLDAHRQLVAALVGSERIEDEALLRTFEATEGHPLFATELVRSLMESHELVKAESGVWRLASDAAISAESLPATIQQAVERRLERLSNRHRDLLSAAAVAGRFFTADELAHLLQEPASQLDVDLDELLALGYLREERSGRGDRFAFAGRVVCDVLYAGVTRRRRRALHRAMAEYLEARNAANLERVRPRLLHHYARADVPEKVVEYGLAHARASLASFSTQDAITAARQALEFAEEDALPRAEARALLGEALHRAGRTDEALPELEAAVRLLEQIGESTRAHDVAASAAEMAWGRQKISETRQWVDKALSLTHDDSGRLESLLSLGAAAANLRGDFEAARQYLSRVESLRPCQASAQHGERSGTLQIAFAFPLADIDPANAAFTWQAEVAALLFDSLMEVDASARIVPLLAESVESEDGERSLRTRLRDGVEFHDGRPCTAEDVRYTFEHFLRSTASPRPSRALLDNIVGADRFANGETSELVGIEIVSSHELVMRFVEPLPAVAAMLSYRGMGIVPRGFASTALDWRSGFAGTGPFRLVRFEPRRRLEMEANPRYWRAAWPRVERLLIALNVPPSEIAAGFRTGRFSLAFELTPDDHDRLRHDRELGSRYAATPTLATAFVAMNSRRGPMRSRELREELRAAIPIAQLVENLGTLAIPARGLFPPGLLGGGPGPKREPRQASTRTLRYEPLRAGAFSIFATSFSDCARDAVTAIERAGIQANLTVSSEARRLAGDTTFDFYFGRYYCDYPDSDGFGYGLLHSRHGLLGEICGSEDIDRLLERGRHETNTRIRHEIYRELERLIEDEALIVPLFHPQAFCFARPEVESFSVQRFFPTIPFEQVSLRR
jgi:serine/threonine protein kinase/ABC-type transport system substrate-binding protein